MCLLEDLILPSAQRSCKHIYIQKKLFGGIVLHMFFFLNLNFFLKVVEQLMFQTWR